MYVNTGKIKHIVCINDLKLFMIQSDNIYIHIYLFNFFIKPLIVHSDWIFAKKLEPKFVYLNFWKKEYICIKLSIFDVFYSTKHYIAKNWKIVSKKFRVSVQMCVYVNSSCLRNITLPKTTGIIYAAKYFIDRR